MIAVRTKASAAIVGPTLISRGPNVNPETVVKLKSAMIFKPGFRAAKEAKNIRPIEVQKRASYLVPL